MTRHDILEAVALLVAAAADGKLQATGKRDGKKMKIPTEEWAQPAFYDWEKDVLHGSSSIWTDIVFPSEDVMRVFPRDVVRSYS